MLVVQMAIDEVVDMVAVRHSGVPAIRAMHVVGGVTAAYVSTGAALRIGAGDFESVFLDDTGSGLVMQMAIVQIVHMITMLNGSVPALSAVDVSVRFVVMTHE